MKILILILFIYGTCNNVFANEDGQFGNQQIISANADQANTVRTADIDGDGDLDIVSASKADHKVAWYENMDGKGTFGSEQVVSASLNRVITVHAADLDGDGDVDIISASEDDRRVVWFENTNGMGVFGPAQTITTSVQITESVYAADIDGDGDLDVLSSSTGNQRHRVAWYENLNGEGSFGSQRNLIPSNLRGAYSVRTGDMDDDGDLDIVYGTIDQVIWLTNTNGLGAFGSRILIATDIFGSKDIHLTDLDNDGDLDVLFASTWIAGDRISIAWYKNNGNGDFVAQTLIDNIDLSGASSIYSADLDKDGDLDVVSTSFRDNAVVWYENIDGQGAFGPQKIISEDALGAMSVYAADIDGDGDNDVLSASEGDGKIAWYENIHIVIDLIFANTFE